MCLYNQLAKKLLNMYIKNTLLCDKYQGSYDGFTKTMSNQPRSPLQAANEQQYTLVLMCFILL